MKKIMILGIFAMFIVVAMGFMVKDVIKEEKSETMYRVQQNDSLVHLVDSLKTKLFLAKYTIEKVDFYTKIVERKPSKMKFYKGWIRRTINGYKK
jgi:hypothetical protein